MNDDLSRFRGLLPPEKPGLAPKILSLVIVLACLALAVAVLVWWA